jgi:hypothetical protein
MLMSSPTHIDAIHLSHANMAALISDKSDAADAVRKRQKSTFVKAPELLRSAHVS